MQVYKVLKDFELYNEQVRSGQEVACRARDAEKLMKEGFLTTSDRELDPNTPADKALIDKCNEFAKSKHEENHGTEKAEARQEEVDAREAAKDEEEAAKAEEATEEVTEEEESSEEEETNIEKTETPKRTRRRSAK